MAEERLKSVWHAFAVTLSLSLSLSSQGNLPNLLKQKPNPNSQKKKGERERAYELCDDEVKEQLMVDHDVLVHQDRGRVMGLSLQDHTHLCS